MKRYLILAISCLTMMMSSSAFANEIQYNDLTETEISEYTSVEGEVMPRIAVKWYTTIKNAGSGIVVRTGPDTNYTSNGYVYTGDEVGVCGDTNGWVFIQYNLSGTFKYGYVEAKYVTRPY